MIEAFIGRILILWLDRFTTSVAHYDAVVMRGVHLITTRLVRSRGNYGG